MGRIEITRKATEMRRAREAARKTAEIAKSNAYSKALANRKCNNAKLSALPSPEDQNEHLKGEDNNSVCSGTRAAQTDWDDAIVVDSESEEDAHLPIVSDEQRPPPRIPSGFEVLLRKIRPADHELAYRTVFEKSVDALEILRDFCNAPLGSTTRPFDFRRCYQECEDALRGFRSGDWQRAMSHIDHWQERDDLMAEITSPLFGAVREIQQVCENSTCTADMVVEGMATLLDIVDLAENNSSIGGHYMEDDETKSDLIQSACEAMEKIWSKKAFSGNPFICDGMPDLVERLEEYEEFAELKDRINKESEERKAFDALA